MGELILLMTSDRKMGGLDCADDWYGIARPEDLLDKHRFIRFIVITSEYFNCYDLSEYTQRVKPLLSSTDTTSCDLGGVTRHFTLLAVREEYKMMTKCQSIGKSWFGSSSEIPQ